MLHDLSHAGAAHYVLMQTAITIVVGSPARTAQLGSWGRLFSLASVQMSAGQQWNNVQIQATCATAAPGQQRSTSIQISCFLPVRACVMRYPLSGMLCLVICMVQLVAVKCFSKTSASQGGTRILYTDATSCCKKSGVGCTFMQDAANSLLKTVQAATARSLLPHNNLLCGILAQPPLA